MITKIKRGRPKKSTQLNLLVYFVYKIAQNIFDEVFIFLKNYINKIILSKVKDRINLNIYNLLRHIQLLLRLGQIRSMHKILVVILFSHDDLRNELKFILKIDSKPYSKTQFVLEKSKTMQTISEL
ncbi:hypothetical protein BpHYR1_022465 [Brachionus plicatilis]|uniref:Uncharacterized protein n=1 Tax=Brachionus plicatilis TaxID=10195 RepID=A0A3M7R084_BRAPC|nr:hypothetical protein BpHYR1_022465 [Brachionus plicatilis]